MIRAACVRVLLPLLLPVACAWIEKQERRILAEGVPLDPAQLVDARALGITDPARVRLLGVPRIPLPGSRWARAAASRLGSLAGEPTGLTARYGIYLRHPHAGERLLLAHELAHTRQYERLGGIRPFLRQYLHECLTVGYARAGMEWEAIEAASALCG